MNHNPEEPEAVGQVGQWDTPIQYNELAGSKGTLTGGTAVGHGGTLPTRPGCGAQPCRRGAARARRSPVEVTLDPSTVARLLTQYQADRRAWHSSGLIGETCRRLKAAHQALLAAAEAVGDLVPTDLAVIGCSRGDAQLQLAAINALAAAVDNALADLAARGGGRGGSRPLLALFHPPPRFVLAVSCRQALAEQLSREPRRAELVDVLGSILTVAGEEPVGLEDLVRSLPAPSFAGEPTANRPGSPLA